MRVLKLNRILSILISSFSIAKIMRVLKRFYINLIIKNSFSIAKIMRVLKPQMYFSIFEGKLHYNFTFL